MAECGTGFRTTPQSSTGDTVERQAFVSGLHLVVKDLFRVAFGSVMVSFSNYSYEPSLGTRAGAGKPNIDHADVFGTVRRKLLEMQEDIVTFQRDDQTRTNPVCDGSSVILFRSRGPD